MSTFNLLASPFSPEQTAVCIALGVLSVVLIALNVVLWVVFNKRRGERRLYDSLLQQQRELLMQQLEQLKNGVLPEYDEEPEEIQTLSDSRQPEPVAVAEIDESEIEEETTASGAVIRYNRSYTARIIQGSDILKQWYSDLKNHVLSYKGVRNRISWKRETFRVGRICVATFMVRGKTLCMSLATDPKQFEDTKYKVEDFSEKSKNTNTPLFYRIKSARRVKYAKQLIDFVFRALAIESEEREYVDYSKPYASTQELILSGLIRLTESSAKLPAETK